MQTVIAMECTRCSAENRYPPRFVGDDDRLYADCSSCNTTAIQRRIGEKQVSEDDDETVRIHPIGVGSDEDDDTDDTGSDDGDYNGAEVYGPRSFHCRSEESLSEPKQCFESSWGDLRSLYPKITDALADDERQTHEDFDGDRPESDDLEGTLRDVEVDAEALAEELDLDEADPVGDGDGDGDAETDTGDVEYDTADDVYGAWGNRWGPSRSFRFEAGDYRD